MNLEVPSSASPIRMRGDFGRVAKSSSIIDVVTNDALALVLRTVCTASVTAVGLVAILAGVATGAWIFETA